MKSIFFLICFLLPCLLFAEAESKQKICLSGVCIGDDIYKHKINWLNGNKKWDDDPYEIRKEWLADYKTKYGVSKITKYKAERLFGIMADDNILDYINSRIAFSQEGRRIRYIINDDFLDAFKSVSTVCYFQSFIGHFLSKDAHPTKVTIIPVSNSNKGFNLIIGRIERQFRIDRNFDEKTINKIKDQYLDKIKTRYGNVGYNNNDITKNIIFYDYYMNSVSLILRDTEMWRMNGRYIEFDKSLLKINQLCAQNAPISLD